jgi:hypothetical protein
LVVLAAALSGSAHAAIFNGVWDPKFGAPFVTDLPFGAPNNLGWRGPIDTTFFFVPDSCVPTGTATINNADDCDGAAAVTSARVELYNFDLGLNAPPVATLDFNPASMTIGDMRFVDGELTQLSTTRSNSVDPTDSLWQFGVAWNVEFRLFFTFGDDVLADGPHLEWRQCYSPTALTSAYPHCASGINNPTNDPDLVPELRITLVPEPGSLALALLGALGLASRRVRQSLRSAS